MDELEKMYTYFHVSNFLLWTFFWLLLVCLIWGIVALIKKKKSYKIFFILCAIFFILTFICLKFETGYQRKIMVYKTFFDGEGTSIEDIAKEYEGKLNSIAP